jgi:hypothetical protein
LARRIVPFEARQRVLESVELRACLGDVGLKLAGRRKQARRSAELVDERLRSGGLGGGRGRSGRRERRGLRRRRSCLRRRGRSFRGAQDGIGSFGR